MTAAQRLAAVLETLADKHHRTLMNSKLHDPDRRGFRDCECKTCRDASAALDAVPAHHGGEPSKEAVEPNVVTLIVCARSGQLTWECGLAACEYGCDEKELEFVPLAAFRALAARKGERDE